MKILITNDDGWGTAGIRMLAKEMTKLGEVTVLAPDSARSGHGACISVDKPLYINEIAEHDLNGAKVYTTNGTPADCVKLALEVLYKDERPDLVVSGINHGNNCSVNVVYSGTMGACFVATEHGIPAIGFSINSHAMDVDLHWLQPMLQQVVEHLMDEGFAPMTCYNVNAPTGEIEGIKWTRQCEGHWEKEMQEHTDENGRKYWTLAGEFVNHEPDEDDTDIWAVENHYLSITPTTIDLTAYGML